MQKILVTGSGGLVGSEVVKQFSDARILGIDANRRAEWFGNSASVAQIIEQNKQNPNYRHYAQDITQPYIEPLFIDFCPDVVVHCAGQPSHEKSAIIPYEDFQVNTVGTVNLLELTRKYCPEAAFVFLSTNKVYGDSPNTLPMKESAYRFDLEEGIDENLSIDQSVHSPFGANKAAADLIVQEYGKYYGMKTVCFRCGCITGRNHQGVEQHGFLNYLCKAEKYTIFGHKGKQVRDNIHASDVVRAIKQYLLNPTQGEAYNIGGGKANSCSVLEALQVVKEKTKKMPNLQYGPSRKGDHICYYTNYSKFQRHYPEWKIEVSLEKIFEELL